MNRAHNSAAHEARSRLIETGGRTSQDLGLGRIVGQILVYLYLTDGECSLDKIGEDLDLSKASVSIAARQLESLGLLRRSWKKGDRKNYFRTADNIESALQQGLLAFLYQKIQVVGTELNNVNRIIENEMEENGFGPETQFVYRRVKRAKMLRDKLVGIIENPFIKMFTKAK